MFIRQYLPRNTDVSILTAKDINIIQEKLNNRPRKCLDYLTPNEYFYKET
jgi:IS30 family transposase